MKVDQFLAHHGIEENPFKDEDALSDHVFLESCLEGTHHAAWDKIYGSPQSPSTSVVFGEKGSGKTALKLQLADRLADYNRANPEARVFVVQYDDFNPFLDSFRERLHGWRKKEDRALRNWRLWDHMDAILSLGVRKLVRAILHPEEKDAAGTLGTSIVDDAQIDRLSRLQKRDLLLLDAFYNHALDEPPLQRWGRVRKKVKYGNLKAYRNLGVGILVTVFTLVLVPAFSGELVTLFNWWVAVILLAGWVPYLWRQAKLQWTAYRVSRQIRVLDHLPNGLRRIMSRFEPQEIDGQPIPSKDRSDDRYELLAKFQGILKTLGYSSIVVLLDRVDEPHLVNGNAERMRDLLWPLFDNKFLKYPGIGFKMLLPIEVVYYLQREEKEFYERSRLDKQNLVQSLEWTGESLYDVTNDRLRACSNNGQATDLTIRKLFEEGVSRDELIGIFARMRVPRHLFKFLYRLLLDHCKRFSDDNPSWRISRETLQSTLAVFSRDLEAFDRGMGTG
jgi:hypothetical protein